MSPSHPIHAAIRAQVLRGLALNRTPGLHFLGNFLDVAFAQVNTTGSHLLLPGGPHCEIAAGEIHLGAVCLLADFAMSATVRAFLPRETRLGTVSMQLQFTEVPARATLEARAALDGFLTEGGRRLGYTRGSVGGAAGRVCTCSATFMVLEPPPGKLLSPLPYRRQDAPPGPVLVEGELNESERVILAYADGVLERLRANPALDFADEYFGFRVAQHATGAKGEMRNGPHIGNRVGHVQGGVSFAFAATTAQAALGPAWRLSNITASYVSPGQGTALQADASVVHRGRGTGVVHTRVTGMDHRIVLEVLSNYLRMGEAD